MSARQYLRQLQVQSGLSNHELRPVVRDLTQLWTRGRFHKLAEQEQPLLALEWFWRMMLVDPLIARLPGELAEQLRNVVVGVLPTHDPNAWTLAVPPGERLVVVHSGLPRFFLLWQRLIFVPRPDSAEQALDRTEVGTRALVEMFVPGYPWSGPGPTTSLDFEVLLGDDLDTESSAQALGNVQFVLAHEFAHVALGHIGEPRRASLPLGVEVSLLGWRRQQEIDADAQAVEWLRKFDPIKLTMPPADWDEIRRRRGLDSLFEGGWPTWHWFNALFAFQFVESYIGRPGPDSTHPSASERLGRLATRFADELSPSDKEATQALFDKNEELTRLMSKARHRSWPNERPREGQ